MITACTAPYIYTACQQQLDFSSTCGMLRMYVTMY